jgi:hypothetical protein
MELQIESRGGNTRKYALAEIKADIANKRLLFVRSKEPPPHRGRHLNPPLSHGRDLLPSPYAPNLTPKGSITWRKGQRRQAIQPQHHQHRDYNYNHDTPWNVA